MRRCWVNFQCRGVLLICMIVVQGPTALAGGAGGGCLDIFTLIYPFPPVSPSLWETARYRLKYCLKGPLSPKQPTHQVGWLVGCFGFYGPLRQYFRLYRAVSLRGRKRRERIEESKNSKQPPPAPTASAVGPCPTVSKL